MADVPVLLVVAAESGAGKTTLIERLIPELAARGVRAAAVKRTHHDVDLDPPGKDSRRLRDAGAAAVALAGPALTTLFLPEPRDVRALARLVAAAAGGVDLVLVEGGRDEPDLPRVEIVAADGAPVSPVGTLVAIACDTPLRTDVRVFRRDDVAALAAHVIERLA